jgi:hypothetical protein
MPGRWQDAEESTCGILRSRNRHGSVTSLGKIDGDGPACPGFGGFVIWQAGGSGYDVKPAKDQRQCEYPPQGPGAFDELQHILVLRFCQSGRGSGSNALC